MTRQDLILAGASNDDTSELYQSTLDKPTTLTQEKLGLLAENKKNKLEQLSNRDDYANLSNSYTLDNGIVRSNSNKIWNDMTDDQYQQYTSDVFQKEIHKRDDGSMYQIEPGTGREIEYNGDISNTRRLYGYGTKDDNKSIKIGLAAGDMPSSDYRYQPGRANREGLRNPTKPYGHASGPNGVDINKKYFDILLPYEDATAYEAVSHGRRNSINGRKFFDPNTPEAKLAGSGKTEYYKNVEGLFGDTSKSTGSEIPEYKDYTNELGVQNLYGNEKASTGERISNTLAGAGSAFIGAGIDIADLVAEAADWAQEKVTGKSQNWDAGTDAEKTQLSNDITGYDNQYTARAARQVKDDINYMSKNGWTFKQVASTIANAAQTPELFGESIGYMMSLMIGGPVSAASKLSKIEKAVSAAKAIGNTAKAAKLEEKAAVLATKATSNAHIAKAVDLVTKNGGLVAVSAGTTNDDIEAYANSIGIKKSDVNTEKMVTAFAGNILLNALDRITDKAVLLNPEMKNGIVAIAKGMGKKDLVELGKGLGTATASIAVSGSVEASTEYAQEMIQEINQQVGEQAGKTVEDAWKDSVNSDSRMTSALLGAAGAQQMVGLSGVAGTAVSAVKAKGAIGDKLNKLQAEKDRRKEVAEDTTEKDKIVQSVKDVQSRISTGDVSLEDITTIDVARAYAESEPDSNPLKKDFLEKVNKQRKLVVDKLEESQTVPEVYKSFGSKASATDFIDDVIEVKEGKISTSLDKKLEEIAIANGLTKEDYKQAKDRYHVGIEAKKGKHGYETFGKAMRGLLDAPNPDKSQIASLTKKINRYYKSQVKYKDILEAKLKAVETEVSDYNKNPVGKAPKSQQPIKVKQENSTSTWVVNLGTKADGTMYVEKASYKQLQDKKDNITGLEKIMSESNIKATKKGVAEEGTQSGIVVDVGGATSKEIIKKRATDAKEYERIGATKVIAHDSVKKWHEDNYGKDNEAIINTGEYTPDDVVVVSVPANKIKTKKWKEEIRNAWQSGATLRLDAGLGKKEVTAINEVLHEGKGKNAKGKVAQDINGKWIWSSKETINNIKQEKSSIEKAKKLESTSKEKLKREYFKNGKVKDYSSVTKYFKGNKDNIDLWLKNEKNREVKRVAELLYKYNNDQEIASDAKDPKNDIEKLEKNYPKVIEEARKYNEKKEKNKREISDVLTKLREVKSKEWDTDAEKEEAVNNILSKYEEKHIAKSIIAQSDSKGTPKRYAYIKESDKTKIVPSEKNPTIYNTKQRNIAKDTVVKELIGDISKLVSVNRATVVNTIDVNSLGEDVVTYTVEMEKAINKIIDAVISDDLLEEGDKESRQKDFQYSDSPGRGLLFSDGKMNDATALAMRLAIDEYITNGEFMLSDKMKTNKDLAQMLGVNEYAVSREMREAFGKKGMLKKTMANAIGKVVIKHLGLSAKKDISPEQYARLVADLGNMAILALVEEGILKIDDTMTTAEYNKHMEGNMYNSDSTMDKKAKVSFVRLVHEDNENQKDIYRDIHDHLGTEETFKRGPMYRKPKKSKHGYKVAKDSAGIEQSEEAHKTIEKLVSMEWVPDLDLIDEMLEDEESLKEAMGYVKEGSDAYTVMTQYDKDSTIGRNDEIDRSIEALKEMKEQLALGDTDKASMWFDWFYSKNGRYMMDSNTINPQTDKLHRFLIVPKDHYVEYTKRGDKIYATDNSGKEKDMTFMMDYAIAQAMGFAVDKKSTKDIKDFVATVKKLDTDDVRSAIKNGEWHKGKVGELNIDGVEIEVEHVAHVYQALKALDKLKGLKEGDSSIISLSAEFDAVTSGFGLKLLQMPILASMDKDTLGTVWHWLNKVGIFKKEGFSGIKSMNDKLAEDNFFDSYQTLAKQVKDISDKDVKDELNKVKKYSTFDKHTWDAISAILPRYDEKVGVTSQLRTLFKDPFMTFNYSAGMASIRKSLSSKIVGEMLAEIAKDDKSSENYQKYHNLAKLLEGKIDGKESIVELLRHKDAAKVKVKIDNKEIVLEEYLQQYVNSSYGAKVEQIMNENFGEFVKAHKTINQSFRMMFAAFNEEYTNRLNELKLGGTTITDEVKLKVIDELRDVFPAIKGPISDSLKSGIGIYKNRSTTPSVDMSEVTPAQTITKTGTNVIRHEIKAFEQAISSGSVVPIHYIDASLMSKIINSMDNSHVIAIHDAVIPRLTEAESTIRDYNKAMLDVGMSYSFVEEINKQLEPMVDKYPKLTIKEYENGEEVEKSMLDISVSMEELATRTKLNRDTLKGELDKGAYVMHMAGTEGSVYEYIAPAESKDVNAIIEQVKADDKYKTNKKVQEAADNLSKCKG